MGQVDVPIRLIEGRPVVDVVLEGAGPFPMIVDTGAGATVLNADLGTEAGVERGDAVQLSDPSGGGGVPGFTHTLSSLTVGGWRFRDVFAVSWADAAMIEGLGAARGVLGVASLVGAVVEFDFSAMVLRLTTRPLEEGDGSVEFLNPQSVIPSVLLSVAGQEVEAHIDTGNGRAIGLPARIREHLTFIEPPVTESAKTASGSFSIQTGRIADTVRFAGVSLSRPMVFLNDRFPAANIGTSALLRATLTVDVGRRRVRVRSE